MTLPGSIIIAALAAAHDANNGDRLVGGIQRAAQNVLAANIARGFLQAGYLSDTDVRNLIEVIKAA